MRPALLIGLTLFRPNARAEEPAVRASSAPAQGLGTKRLHLRLDRGWEFGEVERPREHGSIGGFAEGEPFEAALWGGMGAAIGTIGGPVGAAIGAGVGALIGLAVGHHQKKAARSKAWRDKP